ncbi:C39 family peptidase [Yeguia hominis]|uniref:C39 family peptidase n=1 Tax=Yeguia hominis TaxID=2763662 RepID=A0A926D997_9FIRM|nr:C39 family peptidase [Yeguia hominis]MBC8534745.1 C39 family peptidase [Yeguia hominis]
MKSRRRRVRHPAACWLATTFLLLAVCCAAVAMAVSGAPVSFQALQTQLQPEGEPASADTGSHLLSVPLLGQGTEYPTGCEVVSATMLLQYWKISASVDAVIAALPKGSIAQDDTGLWHGPNPNEAFIGTPYAESSFGCYVPVLAETLSTFLPEGYTLQTVSGQPLSSLAQTYLSNGIPVLIWATVGMQEPGTGDSWVLPDGNQFTWISGEHCLVLTGYDKDAYDFNDPTGEGAQVSYPKELAEDRYQALASQVLVILPPEFSS